MSDRPCIIFYDMTDVEQMLRELIELDRKIAKAKDRLAALERARGAVFAGIRKSLEGPAHRSTDVDLWETGKGGQS